MTTQIKTELIEDLALQHAMPEAQAKTRDYLCQDCLDRRCLNDSICKAFIMLSKATAWEIVSAHAELN